MAKNEKQFLKLYILQNSKIKRLKEMINNNPEKAEEYLKQIVECEKIRAQVENKIYQVDDEILKELLIQKYMCGKTLEQIGLILNYSKRHTERLHTLALQKLNI